MITLPCHPLKGRAALLLLHELPAHNHAAYDAREFLERDILHVRVREQLEEGSKTGTQSDVQIGNVERGDLNEVTPRLHEPPIRVEKVPSVESARYIDLLKSARSKPSIRIGVPIASE